MSKYTKQQIIEALNENDTDVLEDTFTKDYDEEMVNTLLDETEANACDVCSRVQLSEDLYWLEEDFDEDNEDDIKAQELFSLDGNATKWGEDHPCAFCWECWAKPVKELSDLINSK